MSFYIDKNVLLQQVFDNEKEDVLEVYKDFIDKPLSVDSGDITKEHNHVISVINGIGQTIPIRKGVLIKKTEKIKQVLGAL
jgi:hypothetical protein